MSKSTDSRGKSFLAKRRRKSDLSRSLKDGDLVNPIPLGDFLGGVGQMLRLEPRKLPPLPQEGPNRAVQVFQRNWGTIVFSLSLLLLYPLVTRSGGTGEARDELPAGVLGAWQTDGKRYAERRFEIGTDYIVFTQGTRSDDQTVHKISGVSVKQKPDSSDIRIQYLDAGVTYELLFTYSPIPRPGIRFEHQKELLWRPMVQGSAIPIAP
ncbi:MAG: hypothetical protein ABI679_11135 [Gemmatimonadota bacterium]